MWSQSHDSGPEHIRSCTSQRRLENSHMGTEISVADCFLVLASWGAECFGVHMMPFTKIVEVYGRRMEESALEKAHWRNQEDTPEEFKT
ncbi:hypothetical protein GJ744_011070 [Endocarpon pusillum]|uniref:GST C-terminal domain-containing protein n=1 Tax=Endocarpon pusillum TaxID=364733 RepID=A0A8H7AF55_9EURO|nr:hypothetical protein GJ744_011070 [Endocarpon pusillum]